MGCGRYFIVEAGGGGILLVNPFTIIHTTNRSSSPGKLPVWWLDWV